ncbi:MAG: hypothetical protein BJ554DRAFT_356 [Olpidium bornovanus]|uniref:Uncharacterized protein n=1 Tax=Olpidium bornovanus TaxID=278681 RepID=A0A8H7ZUH4_9FUNG|nr:MAG: hypothetical protein BJ554DRAFT_356 [Olpidium bornovanus]
MAALPEAGSAAGWREGGLQRRPSKAAEMSIDALRSRFAAVALTRDLDIAEIQRVRPEAAEKKLLVANRGVRTHDRHG